LTAFQVRIPLRRPIRHASHARTSTDNLVVRCVLEDQTEGYGEGVPREYVTGETIELALDLLRRTDLAAQLEPCGDFAQALRLAERLQLPPVEGDIRRCQGNAARCALELALLDAYGQYFGEPLSSVTQRLAGELYQPRPWVRYSGAIFSAHTPFKLFVAAIRLRLWWFQQVKVKVGMEGHDDVYRLRWIRRWLKRKVDLRLDANEAWPAADVVQRVRELEPFRISAVEQPVAHDEVQALAGVRKHLTVPLMLDESLCSMYDAEQAVAEQTCDLFNLRLSKCGGFIPSLRLAQFARRHGLGYQLGCQIGETALLSAAGRHFATSVADLRYWEGSYDRHLVREALGKQDLTLRWGGWAPALTGPGLGVQIDPVALERVTVNKIALLERAGFRTHGLPSVGLAGAQYTIEAFMAGDGYRWRYRRYLPEGEPRAHVVCIHGIQSHGGWYEYSCERLRQAGFAVSFLDRRGSGLNREARGDAPSFRRLLDDLAEFLRQPLPGAPPTFLLAISWGGKLGAALQRRHPGLIAGLALLCPGFFSQIRPSRKERLAIAWARLTQPERRFPIPLNDPELFSAVPRWQQFLRADPLALREATARLLVESVRLDLYRRVVSSYVRVPVLLLLAERDRIIDNAKTRRFVQGFACTDRTVIEYPGAHHTLEFEPEPDRFINDLLHWLERHCPNDVPSPLAGEG
jgi:muconate cycloisomerase